MGIIIVFTIAIAAWGFWYETCGPNEDEATYNENMYGKADVKKN